MILGVLRLIVFFIRRDLMENATITFLGFLKGKIPLLLIIYNANAMVFKGFLNLQYSKSKLFK